MYLDFTFMNLVYFLFLFFFFSSRRRHTRSTRDWSSDVCSSDLLSPPEFRGTFPGLAYQLGNFAAAYAAQQQAWLAERFRSSNGQPNYAILPIRSEERRVGKECRSRW